MKKQKKAFTLIELMVVIALIWIVALSAWNLNFNSLSDRQRVDWFFYKIKTNIETIQNNALIWKAIDDSWLFVPKKWRIDFDSSNNWTWSWTIKTYYLNDLGSYIAYTENNTISEKFYSIIIKNWWNILDSSWTWALIIEWWNLSLTWSSLTSKILEIEAKYKDFSKIFTINTISGVIEEN